MYIFQYIYLHVHFTFYILQKKKHLHFHLHLHLHCHGFLDCVCASDVVCASSCLSSTQLFVLEVCQVRKSLFECIFFGFGGLKARGSWQAFVREEFLAMPRESGNLALPRALSVGCSICTKLVDPRSQFQSVVEWYVPKAVKLSVQQTLSCRLLLEFAGVSFRESLLCTQLLQSCVTDSLCLQLFSSTK